MADMVSLFRPRFRTFHRGIKQHHISDTIRDDAGGRYVMKRYFLHSSLEEPNKNSMKTKNSNRINFNAVQLCCMFLFLDEELMLGSNEIVFLPNIIWIDWIYLNGCDWLRPRRPSAQSCQRIDSST
jgi:hypothetical protein